VLGFPQMVFLLPFFVPLSRSHGLFPIVFAFFPRGGRRVWPPFPHPVLARRPFPGLFPPIFYRFPNFFFQTRVSSEVDLFRSYAEPDVFKPTTSSSPLLPSIPTCRGSLCVPQPPYFSVVFLATGSSSSLLSSLSPLSSF